MICPHCGTENDNLQTLCISCGEPLEYEFTSCPVCGKILKSNADTCPRCHSKLFEKEERLFPRRHQPATSKFIAKVPLTFLINLILLVIITPAFIYYTFVNRSHVLRVLYNEIGVFTCVVLTLSTLIYRITINSTQDVDKLERRITILKSLTCVSIVSNLYVFIFVMIPFYFNNPSSLVVSSYFGAYIAIIALSLILLPLAIVKGRVRTR